MNNDYWSEQAKRETAGFASKIQTFSGKSSDRGDWMEDNLTPMLEDTGEGVEFLRPFEQATLMYHVFAAEKRKTGKDKWKDDLRAAYRGVVFPAFEVPERAQQLLHRLGLGVGPVELGSLPTYSFLIRFGFTLKKPYLSRGDTPFYVVDNPIRKEKVFKVPIAMPSQWKGALRAAISYQLADWWLGLDEEERAQRTNYREFVLRRAAMTNLLGNEKGVVVGDGGFDAYLDNIGGRKLAEIYRRFLRRFVTSTGFRAGRLRFFPTFFTRIGLEVINPHERSTRAGTQPIYLESVPPDAEGTFTLLYVPFDLINRAPTRKAEQVADDLRMLCKGIYAMMTAYGFGAKTSSGFGLVENTVEDGHLTIRIGQEPVPLPFGLLSELVALANVLAREIQPGGSE